MSSDGSFPLDEAHLVALFLESLFYGINLMTFVQSMSALLWSDGAFKRRSDVSWNLFIVAVAMFVISTMDIAIELQHNLQAFIFFKGAGGPLAQIVFDSYVVNVWKSVNIFFQTLIGDGILTYRCYVVYGRKWIIIALPVVLWIGQFVLTIIIIRITATAVGATAQLKVAQLHIMSIVVLGLTLALNLYATSAIVLRISRISRKSGQANQPQGQNMSNAIRIIVESGLLYTVSVLITFVVIAANSNASIPMPYVVLQVTGISFNLIIVRVAASKGNSYNSRSRSASEPGIPIPLVARQSQHTGARPNAYPFGRGGSPGPVVQISVSKQVDQSSDVEAYGKPRKADNSDPSSWY